MLSVSGTANERKRKQPDKGKPLGSWALWLLPLGWMALIFAASHTPASDIPSLWFWTLPESDKIAHSILYFILCLTLYVPLSRRGLRARPGAAAWVAAGLAVLYGVSDELHQYAVPGRTPSLGDLGADFVGASLATLLAQALPGRRR